MTAFTPNRQYPYAQSTDPMATRGITYTLQALATRLDTDIQNLTNLVRTRPMAKVSANIQQTFPPDVTTEITYDTIQVDTDGISNLSQYPTRLYPTLPGLWFAWAEIEVPYATWRTRDLFLRKNAQDIGRSQNHQADTTGTNSPTKMWVAGMALMNGTTDYFVSTLQPDQPSPSVNQLTTRRSFGCFRCTLV